MPKLSDCNALDPTSDPSSTVPSNSCKIETVLHDKTEQAKQNALAHLSQAQAALQEWRSALELEGVLHGEIHTYPHHQGITRHNFYPATPDRTGKKRRRYVSLESLPHYRADIARGRQCHQLRQISAQITDLMQSVRSLA